MVGRSIGNHRWPSPTYHPIRQCHSRWAGESRGFLAPHADKLYLGNSISTLAKRLLYVKSPSRCTGFDWIWQIRAQGFVGSFVDVLEQLVATDTHIRRHTLTKTLHILPHELVGSNPIKGRLSRSFLSTSTIGIRHYSGWWWWPASASNVITRLKWESLRPFVCFPSKTSSSYPLTSINYQLIINFLFK